MMIFNQLYCITVSGGNWCKHDEYALRIDNIDKNNLRRRRYEHRSPRDSPSSLQLVLAANATNRWANATSSCS